MPGRPRVRLVVPWGIALVLGLLGLSVPPASAAAILQLTPGVTPTSFTPGDSGALTLAIKNAGNATASQLETTILRADAAISVKQTGIVALGGIGALETTTFSPFTFAVASNATPGIYRVEANLNFRYIESGASVYTSASYGVSINVRAADTLLVRGVTPDRIEPGQDVAAVIQIANSGTATYRNLAGSWTNADNTILPLGGSNRFQVASVPANSVVDVPVRLAADTAAAPGLYALTFELRYLDVAGNTYTSTSNLGIWVGSGSGSDLSVNIQNLTSDEITVVVTNVGIQAVTGIQIRLVPLEGFALKETDTIVLGNLLPGEFKAATYEVRRSGSAATARADVDYTDSSGQRRSTSTPLSLGEGAAATGTSEVLVGVVTALVIFAAQALIGVGWMVRRRVRRRQEAKEVQEEADFAELAKAAQQDTEALRR